MRKVVRIIGNICFIAAVVLLGFLVFAAAGGNTPSLFGYRMLRVVSGSMQPLIQENTCILIHETDAGELKVGDVITFVSTDPAIYGYYNTHRIYDIYEDAAGELCFVTKGDASDYPDAYDVTADRVVGRFVGEVPGGRLLGGLIGRLHERNIYFLVVILPLLLCLVSYVWQLGRSLSGKRRESGDGRASEERDSGQLPEEPQEPGKKQDKEE